MRVYLKYFAICTVVGLGLTACDRTNREPSLFRTIDDGTASLVTDAKQRIIINRERYERPEDSSSLNNRQICAEPSPDVTQAFAEVLKIAAALDKPAPNTDGGDGTQSVGGSLASAFSSSVAQLGERLAVIQLFRDRMYRACEAFANGSIDRVSYTLMLARNDKAMATLLTTEMAAGAFGRAGVQIGGSAVVGDIDAGKRAELHDKVNGLTSRLVEASKQENASERENEVGKIADELAAAHAQLLAMDLTMAKAAALPVASGDQRAGSIRHLTSPSGSANSGADFAEIHRRFMDDPGLEPLFDACLTALVDVDLDKMQAETVARAQKNHAEAVARIVDEYNVTLDVLGEMLEDGIDNLTAQQEQTAIDLGVSNTSEESSFQEVIDLANEKKAKAEEEIHSAEITITTKLLEAGNPFASFCATQIFGNQNVAGFIPTMLNARRELRELDRPTANTVQLRRLDVCAMLAANFKGLDAAVQGKIVDFCDVTVE